MPQNVLKKNALKIIINEYRKTCDNRKMIDFNLMILEGIKRIDDFNKKYKQKLPLYNKVIVKTLRYIL